MKRKSLLFALLLAFALPWAASAQQALPYSYGFEDNDLSADGWTSQYSSGSLGISSSAAYEDSYGFRFSWNAQDAYLVSPLLTGTNSGVALSFYYKEYSSSYGDEQFYVGYTTDEAVTDPSSFTYGDITTASLSWQLYEITLPANTKRVAIKYVYNNAYYLYLDSFAFEVPSSCRKPTGLAATLTAGNGTVATLSWTENGEATNWVLEYGTASDFTGAISVNVSGTPSKDLSGLTAEQTYYARVKPDCDTDGTKWSATCTFTPTNAFLLTVNDGTATNSFVPIYGYWADSQQTSEFIIPASSLRVLAGNIITSMKFYPNYNYALTGSFQVYLKEVEEETFSGTTYYTAESATTVYNGIVTISSTDGMTIAFNGDGFEYNGGNLLVGFTKESGGNYSSSSSNAFYGVTASGASIENYNSGSVSQKNFLPKVTFGYSLNAYPKPRNLAFSNLTTQGVTASWTAPNSDVRSYEYQYGAGEEWTSWTSTTATSVELDRLTPDHTYTFRVKAVYADGESEYIEDNFTTLATCPVPTALAVNPSSITAHEATLTWTADNDSYNIRYQVVNGITEGFEEGAVPDGWIANYSSSYTGVNSQAAHEGSYGFQFNYSESNASLISPLLSGTENGVGVSFYYKESSSQYGNEQFQVGYTTDASVTDAASFTYGDVITASLSWQLYENSFPAGTKRVAIKYIYNDALYLFIDDIEITISNDTWQTATSETTTYNFSGLTPETKYTVQVQGVCEGETTAWSEAASFTTLIACPVPTNLAYDNLTKNSVELSWTETGGATEWEICVNGDEENLVGATTNENFRLRGLTPDTYYTVKVRAVCGGEDGESQWSNAVSFTTLVACPVPVNLNVDEITKNTAVLTWGEAGTATVWQIMLNDDESHLINVTEENAVINEGVITYTLEGLSPQTSYSVKVRANCGGDDGDSQWCVAFGFTTEVACPAPTNVYATEVTYNSVTLDWTENGEATVWSVILTPNGGSSLCFGAHEKPFTIATHIDPETEYTVSVSAICGGDDGESQFSANFSFTTPEACPAPTNLTESNITFTTATLSWEGEAEAYTLQYRPWYPAGDDIITTGTMTTYTVDLSAYQGVGSVAIRHYDVTDMFQLIVDDIEVVNAQGTVVFSEDFEDCEGNIPAAFTNMDLDGDGYVWGIAQSPNSNVNGTYGIVSASYDNNAGALTPDNWLIISGIEMGGTMSFQARGQDASWAAENFAIYVSPESTIIETSVTGNTFSAGGLEPDTPYAWQVKGACDNGYISSWATSFFKTPSNLLVFNKNGNWNEIGNWVDAEGNAATSLPTPDNKVRVDSSAVVPANVIAMAGKTTLGDEGSITIKDGGQLVQSSATLTVTMEKDIIGYGAGYEEEKAGWYFITTPFGGTTQVEGTGTWNRVNNLAAGTFDLYAFDPTSNLEWINYESNPTHSEFTGGNNNGLISTKGYLYASEEDRTVTFTGHIMKSYHNSLVDTYEYTATTDEFNGWKLVGNPFACSVYLHYLDADNNAQPADFYVLNSAGNGYVLKDSYQALAPLTAAFVNYNATSTIEFSTDDYASVPGGGGMIGDPDKAMLNMHLTQGGTMIDQARVRFGNGYNLQHMSFRKNSSKIYIPMDGMDYAVVNAGQVGELPVSFKAENNGTYTLNFGAQEVSFSYLHLIDNMTGNDVDLLKTPSYTFNAQTTDYANRFRLVFATGSSIDGDSFGFVNAMGNLCIFGIEGEATLQVVDVLGHVISSNQFSGSYESKLNVAPGVYMLRLINGNDVKVQKMIVK